MESVLFQRDQTTKLKLQNQELKDPQDIILDMSTEDYFTYAMNLTKTIEPHATDFNLLTQMKKIGLNYGEILNSLLYQERTENFGLR